MESTLGGTITNKIGGGILHFRNGHHMVMSAEEERKRRNKSLSEAASDPAKARAYLLRASMLEERI